MSERPRRRFFRLPFKKDGIRQEVDEELQFHLEMRSERYESEGMPPPTHGRRRSVGSAISRRFVKTWRR